MQAVKLHHVVERDGELHITGLPYKKGQHVEMIVLVEGEHQVVQPTLTAKQLLQSDLIGMWQGRADMPDSPDYARQLREQAQRR